MSPKVKSKNPNKGFFQYKNLTFFAGLLELVLGPRAITSIQNFHTYHSDEVAPGSAPQWRIEPPKAAVFSNSSGARVECVAFGSPNPTIEWYQEDNLITHNLHGLRIVMANGSLVFPPFR